MAENFESLKALADKGNAEAQFSLGQMYWIGEGVESDNEKAEKLIRKAAEQGLAIAQTNLGLCIPWAQGCHRKTRKLSSGTAKLPNRGKPLRK